VVILFVHCEVPALKSCIALLYYPNPSKKPVEDKGILFLSKGIK
jgi:hypothetical protein